jgi:phosphoribosyl 1,2-cyclic phosphodiesterase
MSFHLEAGRKEEHTEEHVGRSTYRGTRREAKVRSPATIDALMCHSTAPLRTIVIDVGKNFQAAAVEWFPHYGLRRIDAVLITHAHADGTQHLA